MKCFIIIKLKTEKRFKYPPFVKLIKITIKHKDLNKVNNSSIGFLRRYTLISKKIYWVQNFHIFQELEINIKKIYL